MSDIIEKNDTPEPSESSQVAAFGGQATEATAVEVPSYMPRRTLGQLLRGDLVLCSSIACSLIYCDTRCIHLLFRTSAPSTRNTEYAHHQQ